VWPSVNSPQGKATQYGAESCPRRIDIINRFGGAMMGPRYDDDDVQDIIRTIRKVYRGTRSAIAEACDASLSASAPATAT
jgi:hypothetical protein